MERSYHQCSTGLEKVKGKLLFSFPKVVAEGEEGDSSNEEVPSRDA